MLTYVELSELKCWYTIESPAAVSAAAGKHCDRDDQELVSPCEHDDEFGWHVEGHVPVGVGPEVVGSSLGRVPGATSRDWIAVRRRSVLRHLTWGCGARRRLGRGSARCSRRVAPSSAALTSPRWMSRGRTSRANRSKSTDVSAYMIVKPSAAPALNHASRSSAICSGVLDTSR
jgi:hypothetical protein